MTDKEIIKALETCILGDCDVCNCKCGSVGDCRDTLNKYSLDLIKHQQVEIERLEKQKEISNPELAKAINKSLEQAKEIGNLKAELNGYMLEPRKRTALDGNLCVPGVRIPPLSPYYSK